MSIIHPSDKNIQTILNFKKLQLIDALKKYKNLKELKALRFQWEKAARQEQLLPDGQDWKVWLIMAGRGFGKTRTGAETVRKLVTEQKAHHIALIAQSIAEAKAVMVYGESGLMNVFEKNERPVFCSSQNKLFFQNGASASLFGANNPERLRGPQFDFVWIDEFAKFKKAQDIFNQVMMCLRLGENPRCLITTTPRPLPFLEQLIQEESTITTKGTTFDNANNLAKSYLDHITKTYANTQMGMQELYAHLLTDKTGALWQRNLIRYREPHTQNWRRIVIAIDPATTHHENSDETGIVVAAIHEDGNVYVLEDLSGRYSAADWGAKVTQAYWRYKADRVVAEVNKGGDLVERVVKSVDANVAYKAVRATRGKCVRAEPIAALYEQEKVFHIRPFALMEQQMCEYIAGQTSKSPDRMDALVWAITDLMLAKEATLEPKIWGV